MVTRKWETWKRSRVCEMLAALSGCAIGVAALALLAWLIVNQVRYVQAVLGK